MPRARFLEPLDAACEARIAGNPRFCALCERIRKGFLKDVSGMTEPGKTPT
jgi:hypothetical protein